MSPKNLFTQSLVLNLVLLAACAYLLMREPAVEQSGAPPPARRAKDRALAPGTAPPSQ